MIEESVDIERRDLERYAKRRPAPTDETIANERQDYQPSHQKFEVIEGEREARNLFQDIT